MQRKKQWLAFVLAALFVLVGCYGCFAVSESQRVLLIKSGSLTDVRGAGMVSADFDPLAEAVVVDLSDQRAVWNTLVDEADTGLVTGDGQPIDVAISVNYQRSGDVAVIRRMWSERPNLLRNNDALEQFVLDRVKAISKSVTPQFTLNQMLGLTQNAAGELIIGEETGRLELAERILIPLQTEATKIGVTITAVLITDIEPSAEYVTVLEGIALARIRQDEAREQARQRAAQLEIERQQTAIELEQANRQQQVNAIRGQTYANNPVLYQLELARLAAEAIRERDKVIFVPEGSNLSFILGASGVLDAQQEAALQALTTTQEASVEPTNQAQ